MKVKNVWKATWFSFLTGFILTAFLSLCFLFNTNDLNGTDDVFIGLFVLGILGAIYCVIQLSFSFLIDRFLVDSDLSNNQLLLCTLKMMLLLYFIVFFICWGIGGFSIEKEVFQFILVFSVPYVLNCLIFVFRLHYLYWRDARKKPIV